jgi:hypothetical protein
MVAFLGADTVVGRALTLLVEDWGYDTIPLDSSLTGVVDELLEGAHLLLFVPRVDEGVREAFLGAMGKSTQQVGDMSVIALFTAVEDILALTVLAGSMAARVKARLRRTSNGSLSFPDECDPL